MLNRCFTYMNTKKLLTSKIKSVNIELARERGKTTFNIEELTTILYDGPEKLKRMFVVTVLQHATKLQKQYWLPKINNFEVIGTYAQTELGHGTFVRGLETTATYDPKSKEFILHRVELGDIGNKQGFTNVTNGYLKLTNHRIPREYMLMRYARVEEDGTYVAPPNRTLTYGTMVHLRVNIMVASATIGDELQIIDYQTQQQKLFTQLANVYALWLAAKQLIIIYDNIASQREKGDFSELPQLHALTTSLKAFSSSLALEGVEECRMACGGHGYSHASGFPKLFAYISMLPIVEGENTVMYLQAGRLVDNKNKRFGMSHLLKMAYAISSGPVNEDLANERKKATFNVEKLTNFIYRGEEIAERRRYIQNLVIQDPFYKTCKPWAFCSREEAYDEALRKQTYINQRLKELDITSPIEEFFYKECAAPHESSPIGLQTSMFIPTIEKQGTEEQKKKWLPAAKKLQIIGTYAQTEMGHGTFLRGIETEARYDPKTKEFVLNTPTLTSMNGKNSELLCTDGTALHTREMLWHAFFYGVELGDIGPKLGYGSNDNGYLRLFNVRISRENMLMRYAKVLEDGTYVPPSNTRLAYGSMVLVRSMIVNDTGRSLSQACVIAIRYSAVRRQTEWRGVADIGLSDTAVQVTSFVSYIICLDSNRQANV
ncbi:hypothetical protein KUTeg_000158 [Tegillarca granosa]|uniref:Acyl-coenzyme A oxidase n=1 Tax=Tegillarca granosa TaxID=220873 RepID=A0ABQ9G069_TEGGR|nr:hypothetical protein KUTeg_000158 [Tegillarca granosa]